MDANKHQNTLVGRKIVAVRATTEAEQEAAGWFESGIIIHLEDGTILSVEQDEEGNGPGFLSWNDANRYGWINSIGHLVLLGEMSDDADGEADSG